MNETHKLGNADSSTDDTVPVNLYNEDGSLHRTIRLKPEFATRFINFVGVKYERVPEGDNAWIVVGTHPESALSGAPDAD